MENILWIVDIVENTPNTPFFSTCSVDIAEFIDPHKAVT